ncbi:MAG: aminotransferase class III-fold pyridoxal phosphate-dependent enzyme, partial [Desulfobulbaceae bacterium]|nr:aminotransferase class III-fold pyridoxal phosphate-dependent enzyme [Desulfobulbaceae bacterium]
AKALGNGLPIGAMLARQEVAASFSPGDHASTFGGNPVACAAAVTVMKIMLADGFLPSVTRKGEYLAGRLQSVVEQFPDLAAGVRGMGLIQGLVLTSRGASLGADIVKSLFVKGVLANFAGGVALRFIPPLVVSEGQIDDMVSRLQDVLGTL